MQIDESLREEKHTQEPRCPGSGRTGFLLAEEITEAQRLTCPDCGGRLWLSRQPAIGKPPLCAWTFPDHFAQERLI